MLIRGETTEDRIAKIAQGFGQGFQNFQQGMDRQRQQSLQDEAARRQQAMQALEIEAKLSEATGRDYIGSGAGESYMTGNGLSTDLAGTLKPTLKAEREQAALVRQQSQDALNEKAINARIKKDEATALKGSSGQNLSYGQKLDLKAKKDAEIKTAQQQDPSYKLEKLGGEGRNKVGALASAFQGLDQMEKSMLDGYGPQYVDANTSMIGTLISDTPYSEGERVLTEVIGRLQSGGAMSETEVKNFRALGPKAGDDAAAKKRKIGQQRDFLKNKLTAFGMTDADMGTLGFEMTSKYVPKKQAAQAPTGGASTGQKPWEKYKQ